MRQTLPFQFQMALISNIRPCSDCRPESEISHIQTWTGATLELRAGEITLKARLKPPAARRDWSSQGGRQGADMRWKQKRAGQPC